MWYFLDGPLRKLPKVQDGHRGFWFVENLEIFENLLFLKEVIEDMKSLTERALHLTDILQFYYRDLPNSLKLFTTLVVIGIDCTGNCKSNYHTITTTTAPSVLFVLFNL
jgi:hypothetical protein